MPFYNETHLEAKNPMFPEYREDKGDYASKNVGFVDVVDESFTQYVEWKGLEDDGANWEDYFAHDPEVNKVLEDLTHESWIYGYYVHSDLMKKLKAQGEEYELQIQQLNAKFDLEREEWQKAFAALKLDLGVQ